MTSRCYSLYCDYCCDFDDDASDVACGVACAYSVPLRHYIDASSYAS